VAAQFSNQVIFHGVIVLYPTPIANVAQKDIEDLHGFSVFSHLIA
jgi:hypothetical protein